MNEFERFIFFLTSSLDTIDPQYFSTEYDGFYAFRGRLRNFGYFNGTRFTRHSERGFAYELYYQMQTQITEYRNQQDYFPGYFLQGEIKKMNVAGVLAEFGYTALGHAYIPDLLFHVPSQDGNAFVIEIKAQPELEIAEILYDLDKLSRFLRRFNYSKAVFMAVNIDPQFIIETIRQNRELLQGQFTQERLNDCTIIIKGSPVVEVYNHTLTQILA